MVKLTRVASWLVKYLPNLAGGVERDIGDKLVERVSVLDFGAKGDGVTDDTAAVNQAIASFGTSGGVLHIPKIGNATQTRYLVTGINNPYGVQLVGEGSVAYANPNGGYSQLNTYANHCRVHFGQEYLHRVYSRFQAGQMARVFLFGDSTVAGNNGEGAEYNTGTILFDMFQSMGLNTVVQNNGVGGTSVYQMNAIPSLSASSDLFIIKYGINDGGTPGSSDRLGNFAAALRSKLAEIRAHQYGDKNQLSIILVGPNSTNDTQHNRDAVWYEKLHGIYIQAARDFQCAYYDTYGAMPDVVGSSNYSMDDPFGNGQGVHPWDTMQCWIWGGLIDAMFGVTAVEKFRSNKFVNVPSSAGAPSGSTLLVNYNKGMSMYRATPANGWPKDGMVQTIRSEDTVGLQRLITFAEGNSLVLERTWNTTTSAWNVWTGTGIGLTIAGGWQASNPPVVTPGSAGLVTVSAFLTNGTVTSGTTVLTGIPASMRPGTEKRFAQANDDGTLTVLGVNPSGTVYLVGGNTKAGGVHVNLSYYAGQ